MKVHIVNVEEGETENHLIFEAYVPRLSSSGRYEFNFEGADIYSSCSMTDKHLKRLKKKLQDDFGYAPFDIKKAKEILGAGKSYEIAE